MKRVVGNGCAEASRLQIATLSKDFVCNSNRFTIIFSLSGGTDFFCLIYVKAQTTLLHITN